MSAVVFHLLSQEGGVNIYAVIWNIMLFYMLLPHAHVWLKTHVIPPFIALFWLKTIESCGCLCVAKMRVPCLLLLLLVLGLGI